MEFNRITIEEQQLKEIQEEEKDSYAKYQAFREEDKNLDDNDKN